MSIPIHKKDATRAIAVILLQSILFILLNQYLLPHILASKDNILILSVLFSFIPVGLYWYTAQQHVTNTFCDIRKVDIVFFVALLFTANFIFATLAPITIEKLLHLFHLSALPPAEGAEKGESILMLTYTCLLGPILEEISYRGVLLSSLASFSKKKAILCTALCFAVMHHDFYQGIAAFITGIILGHIAWTYGLKFSIFGHILLNTLSTFMPQLLEANLVLKALGLLLTLFLILSLCVTYYMRKRSLSQKCSVNSHTAFYTVTMLSYVLLVALIAWDSLWLIIDSFRWQ